MQAEFLIPTDVRNGGDLLRALAGAASRAGDKPLVRATLQGRSECLVLYGIGAPAAVEARKRVHLRDGHVVHWDAAYFSRGRKAGYFRVSIDDDHPQRWLDDTPDDPSRWVAHNVALREDHNPAGHILLVGLGRKSRSYHRAEDWEARKLAELQRRFPGRTIIYRPKPRHPHPILAVGTDSTTPIEQLLKGCALVVCRHSNVAVDAVVAGVPYEAEDGAALWLTGKEYSPANRLSFLHRLAFWQWRADEADQAWSFLRARVRDAIACGVREKGP